MNITTSAAVPDGTYFRTGDVEPVLRPEGLTIFNGDGTRRGWGAPGVTSTVVVNDDDLVAVHIGFHHKHGGGQFWRYYIAGEPRRWAQLSDELRARVLAASAAAPSWAKSPGKLAAERKPGTVTVRVGYKIVGQRADGTLVSLFDPKVVYVPGKRRASAARPDHVGGFYAYEDPDVLMERWDAGEVVSRQCLDNLAEDTHLVLVEVLAGGTFVYYVPDGSTISRLDYPDLTRKSKFAATYLTISRIVREVSIPAALRRAA